MELSVIYKNAKESETQKFEIGHQRGRYPTAYRDMNAKVDLSCKICPIHYVLQESPEGTHFSQSVKICL